jgi:hypothetical protein
MLYLQYEENLRTDSSIEIGLKYDNANMVNESDNNTVCINQMRFEIELFSAKNNGASWQIAVESGFDLEEWCVTGISSNFSSALGTR